MNVFPRAVIAAVAFVLLAFLAALAFGGVRITETSGAHELRTPGQLHGLYETHAACVAAMPDPVDANPLKYQCKAVTDVEKQGFCEDVPPPVVDAEGFTVQEPVGPPELCPDGVNYRSTQLQYPAERIYPNCGKVPVEVVSCTPPPVVIEYDDPAHPPLSEMVLDPVEEPGTGP